MDPSGVLQQGQQVAVPFLVSDADSQVRVAILVPDSRLIDVKLVSPSGVGINAQNVAGFSVTRGPGIVVVEFPPQSLAAQVKCNGVGTYQLVFGLSGEAKELGKKLGSFRYSVIVLGSSGLHLSARADQESLQTGATAHFSARLTEHDFPLAAGSAQVAAQLKYPDGAQVTLNFTETSPGRFEAALKCTQQGIYKARIIAQGKTLRGSKFHREFTRTAYVYGGANADALNPDKVYPVPPEELNPDGSVPEAPADAEGTAGGAPGGTRPPKPGYHYHPGQRCCDCVPLDKIIELLRASR
jgi:hypothetical protein